MRDDAKMSNPVGKIGMHALLPFKSSCSCSTSCFQEEKKAPLSREECCQ